MPKSTLWESLPLFGDSDGLSSIKEAFTETFDSISEHLSENFFEVLKLKNLETLEDFTDLISTMTELFTSAAEMLSETDFTETMQEHISGAVTALHSMEETLLTLSESTELLSSGFADSFSSILETMEEWKENLQEAFSSLNDSEEPSFSFEMDGDTSFADTLTDELARASAAIQNISAGLQSLAATPLDLSGMLQSLQESGQSVLASLTAGFEEFKNSVESYDYSANIPDLPSFEDQGSAEPPTDFLSTFQSLVETIPYELPIIGSLLEGLDVLNAFSSSFSDLIGKFSILKDVGEHRQLAAACFPFEFAHPVPVEIHSEAMLIAA